MNLLAVIVLAAVGIVVFLAGLASLRRRAIDRRWGELAAIDAGRPASLRSERYRRLDAQPDIRSRTAFFAAVSTLTRVLAYRGTTPFMVTLSDALERVNVWRAQLPVA